MSTLSPLGGIKAQDVLSAAESMAGISGVNGYQRGQTYSALARVVNSLRDSSDVQEEVVTITTTAGVGEYPIGGSSAEQYDKIGTIIWPNAWLVSSPMGPSHTVGSDITSESLNYVREHLTYVPINTFRHWQAGVTANGTSGELPLLWSYYRDPDGRLTLCVGDKAGVAGGLTITLYVMQVRKVEYLPDDMIDIENFWESYLCLSLAEHICRHVAGIYQGMRDFAAARYYDEKSISFKMQSAKEKDDVELRHIWTQTNNVKRRSTPYFPTEYD